jgi:tetraacyldisaccharide 4'-kinase
VNLGFSFLLAACYRTAYLLHHRLCLRPGQPLQHTRLIVVGAYRTGGAGKTPFCIWLAEQFAAQGKRVAILCHRYAYDEAELLKRKFADSPQVKVFKTGNRYRTAHEIDKAREFDIVLCDDGFEDSRLIATTTFILSWETPPTSIQDLWPLGNAKSLAQDHTTRPVVQVRCTGENPDIRFAIDKITSLSGTPVVATEYYRQMHIFCGLGDPKRFCEDLKKTGIRISATTFLKDHDRKFIQKLKRAMGKSPDEIFLISEKDAARLKSPEFIGKGSPDASFAQRIYVAHQKTTVRAGLVDLI